MDTLTIGIIAFGVLFLAATWWAILDVATKEFSSIQVKAGWGFVALIPFIGCVIYFVFGARQGKRRGKGGNAEQNNN